eukprot:6244140-Pyramimonas_sp.AAC.1
MSWVGVGGAARGVQRRPKTSAQTSGNLSRKKLHKHNSLALRADFSSIFMKSSSCATELQGP